MKEPKTLCGTCKERENCGSCSNELICPDDIDQLAIMGIRAKAVVYVCNGYQANLPATSSTIGELVKEVFGKLDNLRGYRPPRRKAEAASIIRMLKQYTPDQIISTWQKLKQDKFWQDKELYIMSVESQIGAVLKNGTYRQNPRAVKSPAQYTDPNALRH